MADDDGDLDEARVLRPLQAAVCKYRIALGPRAGQKVLTLQGAMPRDTDVKLSLCAEIDRFSLHAAMRCGADLLGNLDVNSFSLWNDVNILREGVGDFKLHFCNASDVLIESSAVFTAPISQAAAGVYSFASVLNVSRVDLEVRTLLTGGVCCRIEIREVAFDGDVSAVPEPAGWALMGAGLASVGLAARRRRRTA